MSNIWNHKSSVNKEYIFFNYTEEKKNSYNKVIFNIERFVLNMNFERYHKYIFLMRDNQI